MNIEAGEVYKSYWECRNLEIQMLWTRLTMLGTILVLTYTGYGVLAIKVLDGVKHWAVFNLLGVAAGGVGVLSAVLWIAMAKGSKGWFERYEAFIECFEKEHMNAFKPTTLLLSHRDYGNPKLMTYVHKLDSSLMTQYAGRFSVSKIPIVMGQVSLIGWSLIIAAHTFCLWVGKEYICVLVDRLSVKLICVWIVIVCMALLYICRKTKSGSL